MWSLKIDFEILIANCEFKKKCLYICVESTGKKEKKISALQQSLYFSRK
jgi:hypothetical protein